MRSRLLVVTAALLACGSSPADPGQAADASVADARIRPPGDESGTSLWFAPNAQAEHEYAQHLAIPEGFGAGEFTLELWLRLDESAPVGSVAGGSEQLENWSDVDREPYDGGDWWYKGNFLLDGHNNNDFSAGTFSLQLYGGGRLRWLFGDEGARGQWAVQAYPATSTASLLDGQWHYIALVRRYAGATGASLELFVDGDVVASENTDVRRDMTAYWSSWTGFPSEQEGWFWGAEKQAAVGVLDQYEDYKGAIDELLFWSRAKTAAEISAVATTSRIESTDGLVGHFDFEEGSGTTTCDRITAALCMELYRWGEGGWYAEGAPITWP